MFGEGDASVFIALYVDDLLMMWMQREVLEMVKRRLHERFEVKDLGTTTFLNGIELRRQGEGDLLLVQQKYALEVVKRFGLVDSKTVSAPFEPGSFLGVDGCPNSAEKRDAVEGGQHKSLVGSLIYLAVT